MIDSHGFYQSEEVKTGAGGQQGQIGTDFLFAVLNDGIQPKVYYDEIAKRFKYVDDFQDIFQCKSQDRLFASALKNMDLIYAQSTSLGLKLNPSKLKMLAFNIDKSKLNPAFKCVPGTDLIVPKDADLTEEGIDKLPPMLGLGFEKPTRPRGPLKISANLAASNCISRLKACYSIVMTARKQENNIHKRLQMATQLVWTCCFDLGMISCYASSPLFDDISIAHRKLVKLAGLDQLTPGNIVYKLSTTISTRQMASKQVICLGIKHKMVNKQVVTNNRFLIPAFNSGKERPFWSEFRRLFNALPRSNREFITERIDPLDKNKANSVKEHLTLYYQRQLDGSGPIDKKMRDKLVKTHRYSRLKVIKRKEIAKSKALKRTAAQILGRVPTVYKRTPKSHRSRISSRLNVDRFFGINRTFAPYRTTSESLPDKEKRRRVEHRTNTTISLSEPAQKRKLAPCDVESAPHERQKRVRTCIGVLSIVSTNTSVNLLINESSSDSDF